MGTDLAAIYTPNRARDAEKLAALVAAYEVGEPVRPVVVVSFAGEAHALSGSHRVAAMREVFGRATCDDVGDYIIAVDADDLDLLDEARDYLQARVDGANGAAEVMLPAIVACLPDAARAAMDDQV